jgi:predicted heme/steroid binding protein
VKKDPLLIPLILLSIFLGIGFFMLKEKSVFRDESPQHSRASSSLPVISDEELGMHDGNDESLRIYIALDGYVYDVSNGRSFYGKGGVYHFLAGKDSSKALHIMGGNIIKEKYPIIGILNSRATGR